MATRTILSAEVKAWFGSSPSARLDDRAYQLIADRLTGLRWPGDPPAPGGSPWLVERADDPDGHRWWDFDGATKAAKLLLESIPAMTKHWDGLRWAPETSGGYDTIKTLSRALESALPYIEWPFGKYNPTTGRKEPKAWHIAAIVIARIVIDAMTKAGRPSPAISRNSVVARVVTKALIRAEFSVVTQDAVSKHLTRWDTKYGLTPKEIKVLTTK